MIQPEFQYFLDHQRELYKRYPEHYLVITGNFIAAAYPTLDMAILYVASRRLKRGAYLIQQCGDTEACYSIHTSHHIAYGIKGKI